MCLQGLFTNPIYYGIWIVTMISQVVIIQWGGQAFSTTPLTADQWLWCIFLGAGVLLWGQVNTVPHLNELCSYVCGYE